MENPAFLAQSAMQWAWDSTSIGALKFCPRYYQLNIVEGWEPKHKSVHLVFGILLHSARERFYHHLNNDVEHDEALKLALEWLLVATFDTELRRPWDSGDKNKNRFTLVRTFIWYCDHWRHDPIETVKLANGKPAVELSFSFATDYKIDVGPRGAHGGEPIVLCGHMDRLGRFTDGIWVNDLKTTKQTLNQSYFDGFTPDNQMSTYSYASKVVYNEPAKGVLIDACQVAITFSRFGRGIVPRTPDQLAEWYDELGIWFSQAQHYAKNGVWPMNERSCWRCAFRSICSKPASVRERWLKADFQRRMWNPLEARGDV